MENIDLANPWTYITIAGVVIGGALVMMLIATALDTNKEVTKIRKLLENGQSPTGNPTPSEHISDSESVAPRD